MRHPQILVYGTFPHVVGPLEELAQQRRWVFRSVRTVEGCAERLQVGGPTVFVLKLSPQETPAGREIDFEFRLLERVSWLAPGVGKVVVGDAEHVRFSGLAWDLGADYVLVPPLPRDWLPEIVAGLMG